MNRQISTHCRAIHGAWQPAIINEWRLLIWLGFCQRSEGVTSVPLSSFSGVSGGEGTATGKRTQMQTHEHTQSQPICWFPTRSARGPLVPSVVRIPPYSGVQRSHPGSIVFVPKSTLHSTVLGPDNQEAHSDISRPGRSEQIKAAH